MMFTLLEIYTQRDITRPPIPTEVRAIFNALCEAVVVIFIFQLKGFTFTELRYKFSKLRNKSNSGLNSDK